MPTKFSRWLWLPHIQNCPCLKDLPDQRKMLSLPCVCMYVYHCAPTMYGFTLVIVDVQLVACLYPAIAYPCRYEVHCSHIAPYKIISST